MNAMMNHVVWKTHVKETTSEESEEEGNITNKGVATQVCPSCNGATVFRYVVMRNMCQLCPFVQTCARKPACLNLHFPFLPVTQPV